MSGRLNGQSRWAKVLRGITVFIYAIILVDEFIRPSTAEYVRMNGMSFSTAWTKHGSWNAIKGLWPAFWDHIGSLGSSSLFSFLLLSLGFALLYYLFKEIDGLVRQKTAGYFELAVMSLFATLVILSSSIPTAPTSHDRVYDALALVGVAASVMALLFAWNRWSPKPALLEKEDLSTPTSQAS